MNTSWAPSRKWWATQITALTALAIMYVTTGAWDQEETIAAIGIASQAALSWLVPNDPNSERSSWGAGERGTTLVEALVIIFLLLVILVVLFRLL